MAADPATLLRRVRQADQAMRAADSRHGLLRKRFLLACDAAIRAGVPAKRVGEEAGGISDAAVWQALKRAGIRP